MHVTGVGRRIYCTHKVRFGGEKEKGKKISLLHAPLICNSYNRLDYLNKKKVSSDVDTIYSVFALALCTNGKKERKI
jgi:hypothetical protein